MPLKSTPAEVELDLGRYELRRHGRRIKLERKPMELLIFLLSRKEHLVSREDIINKLWRSDLFVDAEPNINNIIRKIRIALNDNSDRPRFLETVVGKGYRFIGPVRVIDAQFRESSLNQASVRGPHPDRAALAAERPSLAILPLSLFGTATDDHGVSLGFADALVSRLANLPGVDVLPTSAVINLSAEMSSAEVGSTLRVRFVVRGAIRDFKGQSHLVLEMFDAHLQRASFTQKHILHLDQLSQLEDECAKQIAAALNRPLHPPDPSVRPRYSKDPFAYSEFMRALRLSASGDLTSLDEAAQHLSAALARDPAFSLAHATLSYVCAQRHFEFDPASAWLEKAEFHCQRALELNPDLAEGHVARAFLLWGPSKNFQHLEAIAALRRALALQNNLLHAYNRLGTILAHIGLLDHAREMYQRGSAFHPAKKVSHSIAQCYLWSFEYDLARDEIDAWRAENPGSKYAAHFGPQVPLMTGDWKEAKALLDDGLRLLPKDPFMISLLGAFYALTGKHTRALECVTQACVTPKSFGHAHHTYYQIACIHALLENPADAFEWLERSVSTGFACWPFFLKDPCLKNLHSLPEFEELISSLQAKYPDHLGLL